MPMPVKLSLTMCRSQAERRRRSDELDHECPFWKAPLLGTHYLARIASFGYGHLVQSRFRGLCE